MPSIGSLKIRIGAETSGLTRGLNNAERSLSRTAKRMKLLSGAFLIGSVVSSAASKIKEFDQSVADLASITGKSRADLDRLVASAQKIGSVSAFSSTQVVELQTELAKLGFSEKEILNSTKAIGDFSIALGTDAASAAKLSGAVLRSFGIDASKTEGVLSSLALATTKSALDFEKLNVGLATVGPVANAAGVGINRTTALLGILADRGLDASTASTSLRNIFLDLSKSGLTWDEAMKKINNATDKLSVANALFGKRGATTALILAQNASGANDLEKAITGANGALQEMTEKRLDTLQGGLTILSSAWEGFVLSVDTGDGVLSNAFKTIVDGATGIVTAFTELNNGGVSKTDFFLLFFGNAETRKGVLEDLERTRKVTEEIALGTRAADGSLRSRSNRGGGLGALRNYKAAGDAAKEFAETVTTTTKKTTDTIKTFGTELSGLETQLTSLTEKYVSAGTNDTALMERILGKRNEIIELNQKIQESIDLVKSFRSIEAPESLIPNELPKELTSNNAVNQSLDIVPSNNNFEGLVPEKTRVEELEQAFEALGVTGGRTQSALASSFATLGSQLSKGAENFETWARDAKAAIKEVIAAQLSQFIAGALSGLGPLGLILGPIVGGAAASLFNGLVPKFANGGVVYGPTLGLFGEYAGASNNPEIVTPENLMRKIVREEGGGGATQIFGRITGRDILLSNSEASYVSGRSIIN